MSHALPLVSVVIPIRGDTALLAGLLDDLPPAAGVETIVSRTGSLAPAEAALRALRPDVIGKQRRGEGSGTGGFDELAARSRLGWRHQSAP